MEPIYIQQPYAIPHFVYRIYDEDGVLLYVGSTNSVRTRLNDHFIQKAPWFRFAHRVEMEQYATRYEAREAERAAILTEGPIGNTQNTSRHRGNSPADIHPRLRPYVKPKPVFPG
ncbi:G-I-Y-Y-I-G endonuclease [Gordonia phage Faith5x5]|nr:G-I-Y-Y-I-G endonuclease [Gordonia phage Faith5x5]